METSALKKLSGRISIEEMAKAAERIFGQTEKTTKKVSVYLSHRYSGKKLKEIGAYFGISESGVSQASRRFEEEIDQDKKLKKKVALAKRRLRL